ncbi:hypothetical protein [Aeromonas cavernicola]|uniref:Uncharacterized protein n=1 Tax=Aeromonas cavernicola TaxID=1006623 RepID=A0A2H9U5N3_9GAMM|nr:hypothetical protein [Aeromonas cavernicola]PJG59355.1 hypothetical protein CUC53_07760 [Aeromonas cavernicola]
MNLSLVSQLPSAPASQKLLNILRSSAQCRDYFTSVSAISLAEWQPAKEEAAILLCDERTNWDKPIITEACEPVIGLPVLPLLLRKDEHHVFIPGPDVSDFRFYFVSNGLNIEEMELADPACNRILLNKLESYFPLLSRLILLRQKQSVLAFN